MPFSDDARLFDILVAGGWVMVPLLLCSCVTLAIIVERFIWGPRAEKVIPKVFIANVRQLLTTGKLEELTGLCRATDLPIARVILAALRHTGMPRDQIVDNTQAAGRREALRLQRYMGALGTIASVSPLMGLLGTVSGMIHTFAIINREGVGQAQILSGGISEALITTATGLAIAIPALFFYRYFLSRVKFLVSEMEEISLEVIDAISQQPVSQTNSSEAVLRAHR